MGVLFSIKNKSLLFALPTSISSCDIGNSITVIENTPDFTFFNRECEETKKEGGKDVSFYYYIFDKKHKQLVEISDSPGYQKKPPTLTLASNVYKFRWNYSDQNGNYLIYYDFRIKGAHLSDIVCKRSWVDEIDSCEFKSYELLPSNQYKISD